jgi:hypothetical protein
MNRMSSGRPLVTIAMLSLYKAGRPRRTFQAHRNRVRNESGLTLLMSAEDAALTMTASSHAQQRARPGAGPTITPAYSSAPTWAVDGL